MCTYLLRRVFGGPEVGDLASPAALAEALRQYKAATTQLMTQLEEARSALARLANLMAAAAGEKGGTTAQPVKLTDSVRSRCSGEYGSVGDGAEASAAPVGAG